MDAELRATLADQTIRLIGLDYLVQALYFQAFSKASEPVEALQRYAEDTRSRLEHASELSGVGPQIAFEEYLSGFYQRVAGHLAKAAASPSIE